MLAPSLAFYLHHDIELMDAEEEEAMAKKLNFIKKMMIRLGWSTTKEVQERTAEINHLKFQIKMLTSFRSRNIRLEFDRASCLDDKSKIPDRVEKIKR